MKKDKESINESEFNKIVKRHIINRNSVKTKKIGHYQEQYKYIDREYNIHILKFENITADFNNLMKKYSLNIELDIIKNKSNRIFTVDSFSPKLIKLINTVYDKDFKMFDYKKIYVDE